MLLKKSDCHITELFQFFHYQLSTKILKIKHVSFHYEYINQSSEVSIYGKEELIYKYLLKKCNVILFIKTSA